MSKEDASSNVSEVSGVHDIHDYCKFNIDGDSKQDVSPPSSVDPDDKHGLLDEIVVPNIEAEEVLLETVIDESHVPVLLKIKEEASNEEVIMEEAYDSMDNEKMHSDIVSASAYGDKSKRGPWTDDNIKLLLEARWQCRESFRFPTPSNKPWTNVLKKILAMKPEFEFSELEISNKFRNLCGTYRHNSLNDRKSRVSWPWFNHIRQILADKEQYATSLNKNIVKRENERKSPPWHNAILYNDWTEGHVNLLIKVCEEYSDELKINPRKVNVWKAIKNRMHAINSNFRKTYPRVYSQWKALVKQYRGLKRTMRKRYLDGSNATVKTPPWFIALDRLLHTLDTDQWDLEEDFLTTHDDDEFLASGDEFTTSPASENLRRSKRRKSVSWKLKQMETDSTEDSSLWNDTNIELLISSRTSCEGEFQHTERTFQDNWTLVRDKICSENPEFNGTYLQCADKWKSLIKTYHLVRAKRKVKPSLTWQWYERMDQALWSQHSDNGNSKAINESQICVANTNLNSPDNDVAHQVIVIQEDGTLIASTEEHVTGLYTVVTPGTTSVLPSEFKDNGGKLWTDQTTACLIRARSLCSHDSHGRKKTFWKNVRKRMLVDDPTFPGSAEQCWSKWRNLQQTYNANKRRAETFGIKSVGWEWFTPIDKIMRGETALEEPFTDHETGEAISQMDSDDDDNHEKSLPGSKLWTNKNIRLLLNVREECNELFTTSRSVQGVWQVIRDRMAAIDPSFPGSPTECNDKFRNLLGTYRINKRRKDRLGREHVYWRWFDDMERIMKASLPRLNLAKLADISDIEDDSNPLVTDNENFFFSDIEGVDDFSDKMWNGHNIKLLILCREEFHEQFAKNSKNNTWEKVRDRMIQLNPDFSGSAEDCSRKWRNLGTTYRQVKKRQQVGGESVTWQWFFLIDRYFTQKHGQNLDFLLMDEDLAGDESSGYQDSKVKRNDNMPYQYWLKEYLIRREERDRRAEAREERMLNLMEQLLSLEKKRISTMNRLISAGSSFDKVESQSNIVEITNGKEHYDSPSNLSQEHITFGPKTQRTHNLDTRAGLLEQVHSYDDREFKNSFRVSRDIFKILMLNVAYSLDNTNSGGRPRLGKELALLMSLWLLGNGNETFRTTGVKFGISESTCYRIHKLVVKRIAELNVKYIKWPTGELMDAVRNGFNALKGDKSLPGVVGCVDGTHIAIKKQTSDPSYMNPNKHHSVILQACCDHRGLFLDVCAGWPGSYHDATVWRASPLYQALETDPDTIPSECHLVGDFAYPLSTYLMKPYNDEGALNPKQQQYNETLLSTWEVVEGAFALLKARCGCLKKMLDSLDLDFIKDIIMACCVLHNICIIQDDDNKYDITMDTTVELDSGLQHYDFENEPTDIAAELKRSALTELVWRRYRN